MPAKVTRNLALFGGLAGLAACQTATPPDPAASPSPPVAATAAPVVEPVAPKRFGLHLASYRKQANAERGWTILTNQAPELAALSPLILPVDLPEKGHFLRLFAVGPQREALIRLCRQLQARDMDCTLRTVPADRLPAPTSPAPPAPESPAPESPATPDVPPMPEDAAAPPPAPEAPANPAPAPTAPETADIPPPPPADPPAPAIATAPLGAKDALPPPSPVSDPTPAPEPTLGRPAPTLIISLVDETLYLSRPGAEPVAYPVSLGRHPRAMPTGRTEVVEKRADPVWYPGPARRHDNPDLPAEVPPGPDNPLGPLVLDLSWPNFLIQGDPVPAEVTDTTGAGDIRLTPTAMAEIYEQVGPGTPVLVELGPVVGLADR